MQPYDLEEFRRDVFELNANSLAALMLVLCEYITNLEDEIRFIWRWPMNRVSAIYLVARYTVLLSLILNALFLMKHSFLQSVIANCHSWFTFFTALACISLFAIDTLSMIRVYLLYNRNLKFAAFASFLILAELTLVTTCTSTTVPNIDFTATCTADTPIEVLYLGSFTILTQMVLILLTFYKLKSIDSQLHVPCVLDVVYQGMWLSLLIILIFLIIVPYSLITGTSKPHLVLIWPTALDSSALCRVILNFRRASSDQRETHDGANGEMSDLDIQFTTWFGSVQCEEWTDVRFQAQGGGTGSGGSLRRRTRPSSSRSAMDQNGPYSSSRCSRLGFLSPSPALRVPVDSIADSDISLSDASIPRAVRHKVALSNR